MDEKFLKPYDAGNTEKRIYEMWEQSGLFSPDICIEKGFTDASAKPFSIVLPPPNVTGTLHMGSSLMLAIEDTVVRFQRMRGKRTLWIPGMDHAAIATQSKVEKILEKEEGKRKSDLGREAFLQKVNEFAESNRALMTTQLKALGSSLDFSREAYTLDAKRSLAVRTAFKQMYDEGLIYRGHKVINWDPKGQTTISDDEIVYEERKGKIYTFKYSSDFPIAIATTRPETKVGDTGVAVNPSDTRYQKYIGQTFEIKDFAGTPLSIKIVGDDSVDPEYGTGAVGVTPAHSMIDAEIARKHSLPTKQVINEYAKMMVETPALKDKKVAEAREIIAEWLRNAGLMEKEEEISQNISTAERTGAVIEPLPKLQWFIDVNKPIPSRDGKSLKELMHEAVEKDGIKILPDRFEKVYFHWIENLRDWCISRQIWFGHRIPVWYKDGELRCEIEAPEAEGWVQDEDTLDTWFSSGLWTFSTLGWPEQTKDLETYHPTALLETGYDILFFWVARMILMSKYLIGEIPFKTVYLHGLVRDSKGQKISKSLGNNVEPLEMIAKYGADAVRMSLLVGTGAGNDSKMSEEKLKAYKHFANKLWNMARFVFDHKAQNPANIETPKDKEYLEELKSIVSDMTTDIEAFRIHLASEKIYHYVWHKFADVIIEEYKQGLVSFATLDDILETCLKLLHPFMPFVTEEIWQSSHKNSILTATRWPM
ncbi:MAG: valine--tRNA ligase [Patescibacteria group bacterium]